MTGIDKSRDDASQCHAATALCYILEALLYHTLRHLWRKNETSNNPYEAPPLTTSAPAAIGVLSGTREDLRSVAKYQKGILICILVYLIAVIGQIVLPQELRILAGIPVLIAGIVGAVFVFLLAIKVYGTGLGIVLGILSLIPCIGLIVLLIVNQKATSILKQNGIQVGLLGANLSAV